MDNPDIRYEDYKRILSWVSNKLVIRASRVGLTLSHEDVYQELSIVWLKCREGYNPEFGVKFSTYLVKACLQQYANIIRSSFGKQPNVIVSSIYEGFSDDEDSGTLYDMIEDISAENPERSLMIKEEIAQQFKSGTNKSNTLKVYELAVNPPEEILSQLEALKAQKEWAESRGLKVDDVPVAITPSLVRKALRFDWRQRLITKRGLE